MSLNIQPGIGERSQRVFTFAISGRASFGEGFQAVGRAFIDLRKFAPKAVLFKGSAQITNTGISGKVQLYDVTGVLAETLLHEEAVSSDQPTPIEAAIALDGSSEREVEVRIGLDPGSYGASDLLIVWSTSVEIRSVF